jgi:hypothetical protein
MAHLQDDRSKALEKLRREHQKLDQKVQVFESQKWLSPSDEAEVKRMKRLKLAKLDAKRDVTLIEVPNSAVPAAVKGGQATLGVSTEPMITQGIRSGLWSEPFFNVPKELGPYAYSTINVRLDSIQKEPEVVKGFVKGMVKGLIFLYANPNESAEIAKKQFPTMALDDLKATLDRSFRDEMWSKDGMISKQAWATGSTVVREAGILKTDVKYEEIIDMSFVHHPDCFGHQFGMSRSDVMGFADVLHQIVQRSLAYEHRFPNRLVIAKSNGLPATLFIEFPIEKIVFCLPCGSAQ